MSELMTDLFHELDTADGNANERVIKKLVSGWRRTAEPKSIRADLIQWCESFADIAKLRTGARETATHYVWPLVSCDSGCSVCINEFKDPLEMAVGYATTLHDHRYSFVSLVLSGGYTQIRDAVELCDRHHVSKIHEVGQDILTEGDIVVVNDAEFHRIKGIRRSTITLVVKCPPTKNESLSIDLRTGRVRRHMPVEARVGRLIEALALTSI